MKEGPDPHIEKGGYDARGIEIICLWAVVLEYAREGDRKLKPGQRERGTETDYA